MARQGFKPTISRSEVACTNHYLIGPLLENQQIYLCNIHCDETKSESWPECTARVKLELTDFSMHYKYINVIRQPCKLIMHMSVTARLKHIVTQYVCKYIVLFNVLSGEE